MISQLDAAVERFAEGFSCSQAVFSAFSAEFGLPAEVALKIASAFGGGIARKGEVCGAVTGALMALGLARGHADNEESSKAANYDLVDQFLRRFQAAHASITCRELIGHSVDTPEGLQRAREAEVFKTVCPRLVADAAGILASILERTPHPRPDGASQ
jgi:C_GCAxxG_C_C family probable redox protein